MSNSRPTGGLVSAISKENRLSSYSDKYTMFAHSKRFFKVGCDLEGGIRCFKWDGGIGDCRIAEVPMDVQCSEPSIYL